MLYIDSVSAAKSKLKIRIKFLAGISETKVFCEVITTTREIKVINEFPDVSEEVSILVSITMIYLSMLRVKKGVITKWYIYQMEYLVND